MMRKLFWKIYRILQKLIIPKLRRSVTIYEEIVNSVATEGIRLLDVGCGNKIFHFEKYEKDIQLIEKCDMVVGVDSNIESLKNHKSIILKICGNISNLPFKDNSFDIVISNMVVEHLDIPERQFSEIQRILKPRGKFIFLTPNLLNYLNLLGRIIPNKFKAKLIYFFERRKEDDIFPTYYLANTEKSILRIANKTGFQVKKIKMVVTTAEFVMIPPLAFVELLWIKILMKKQFKPLRQHIIGILEKVA